MFSAIGHRWLLGLLVGGRFDRRFLKINRRGFGHVGAEAFAKGSGIVGINPRILRCAGDGDISEARVDEFRVNGGVHVDQYPFGGESLGTVGGHGIAVVEVPHLRGVEADGALLLTVYFDVDLFAVDPVDGSEVSVGDTQLSVCGRELDAVALGEVPADLPVGVIPCSRSGS